MISRLWRWLTVQLLPLPLNLLANLVPKRPRLWVFGSGHGQRFDDNSRALFLYVRTHHPEINAVWISRSRQVLQALKSQGHDCLLVYSASGVITMLQASVAVVSDSYQTDLSPWWISRRTRLINLWHGSPIKRLLEDTQAHSSSLAERLAVRIVQLARRVFFAPRPSLAIALCEQDQRIFQRCFCPRVEITGYPRNDCLLPVPPANSLRQILYAPTFRGRGERGRLSLAERIDWSSTQTWLESHQARLLIKLHPVDQAELPDLSAFERISILPPAPLADTTQLLSTSDVLITDYSSIYVDYLLQLKPIVYYVFDRETYETSDRGFYYDFDHVSPGPKLDQWKAVLSAVENYLQDPLLDLDTRRRIRDFFHLHADNLSTLRVFEAIHKP